MERENNGGSERQQTETDTSMRGVIDSGKEMQKGGEY